MSHENIATLVKGYRLAEKHSPLIGRMSYKATKPDNFDDVSDRLFSGARRRIYETNWPIWDIQTNKENSLDFLAHYRPQYGDHPLGIFTGESSPEIIDETCKILQDMVFIPQNNPLDPLHWFNQSTTRNLNKIILQMGLVFTYGKYGLPTTYNLITRLPNEFAVPLLIATPIITFLVSSGIFNGILPGLGSLGDKKALKCLPLEARHFAYGIEAVQLILERYNKA